MDAMQWLQIISALAKLTPIPYAGFAGELTGIFVKLMADIKEKTGLSDEQIMEKANLAGIANQALIDAELLRLEPSKTTAPLPPQ
jgi:hypothetical protein